MSLPLTSSGDNNLSAPLGGLVDQLGTLLPPRAASEVFRLVSIVGLVALLATGGWLLVRTRSVPLDAERIAWIGAVAVVVLLNAYLWSGATAFMRAATEAGLLSILLSPGCASHASWRRRAPGWPASGCSPPSPSSASSADRLLRCDRRGPHIPTGRSV